jgi:uncharacterized protein YndB with AHSA1/START domain
MEHERIEREIFIEASPEIVFDVVSSPEHLRQWWPDDAEYEPTPGSNGRIVFGDADAGGATGFAVMDAQPPRLFSFRWTQPVGTAAEVGDSLLVTFELTPTAGGTRLRMTETGFRDMSWDAATLETQYAEHEHGWDYFLPRLAPYVARLAARS